MPAEIDPVHAVGGARRRGPERFVFSPALRSSVRVENNRRGSSRAIRTTRADATPPVPWARSRLARLAGKFAERRRSAPDRANSWGYREKPHAPSASRTRRGPHAIRGRLPGDPPRDGALGSRRRAVLLGVEPSIPPSSIASFQPRRPGPVHEPHGGAASAGRELDRERQAFREKLDPAPSARLTQLASERSRCRQARPWSLCHDLGARRSSEFAFQARSLRRGVSQTVATPSFGSYLELRANQSTTSRRRRGRASGDCRTLPLAERLRIGTRAARSR